MRGACRCISPASAGRNDLKSAGEAAELAVGNQEALNFWFDRLKKDADGLRVFGVHRYEKPPVAMVPTLTIFVGHKVVDLDQLKVPAKVRVGRLMPGGESDEDDAIDAFLKRRESDGK